MYRLYYVSSARPDLNKADIEDLVRISAENNTLRNITSSLGYDGERFAQILEGARDDVLALMDRIRADDRHSGIVVMGEKPIKHRICDGGSLKHIDGLIFEYFESAMANA